MAAQYRVGLDIGSSATKLAVLKEDKVLNTLVLPTGYSSVDAAQRALDELKALGISPDNCLVVATGYGRISVSFADKVVTEITCHARGAYHLFKSDGVVIDIGGQDTKGIVVKGGHVAKFSMNDKCSAGTGKFLEIMANRLGVSLDELSALAREGSPTQISSMCTVFAESEVISLIGRGVPREDIAWGVIDSVISKVVPLVPQLSAANYFLTGGLCENTYLIERLSAMLGAPVFTLPEARYAGAIGAALSGDAEVK